MRCSIYLDEIYDLENGRGAVVVGIWCEVLSSRQYLLVFRLQPRLDNDSMISRRLLLVNDEGHLRVVCDVREA